MRTYILRRLLLMIPTLIGVSVLIFIAMRVIPGDPLRSIAGEGQLYVLSDEELAIVRHSLGLDRALHIQYLAWLGDIFKGDLGFSFWRDKEPIRDLVLRRGPITVEIAVMAMFIAWAVGLPVGMISAMKRNTLVDNVLRFIVTLFMAIPNFWLALTLILISVLYFSWRPPLEIIQLWDDPVRNLQMTVGPALALGIAMGAVIARMTRATVLESLGEDYVRTARAKGLGPRIVVWRHVLRNALLPVVTLSGIQLGALLGGTVAVERAFSVPGLGFTLIFAIIQRDWMLIQNLVLLFGTATVVVNFAVDLTYGWIDPRIRYD
ncbi:MAG: ABC transporter permease [SAR202 cluster bacterium]|jgi:peptide/nickel transport system permease protein|nr:ABC transporter permease [SAR202 cluster bacterium]